MGQRDVGCRRFRGTAAALVTIVAITAGCSDGTTPSPPSSGASTESTPIPRSATAATPVPTPDAGLAADFPALAGKLNANVGVVLLPVGDEAATPVSLGDWTHGPAWSTIKVPLSIAALRGPQSTGVTSDMRAAITQSDNASAEAVWSSLGPPEEAKQKVEAVLTDAGAPTMVESKKVRPEYSAFGQTDWSLTDQARFLSSAACEPADQPIFGLMGEVEGDQRWGLGVFDDSQIKGGWGPSLDGKYLVRQMGVITTANGSKTAVAMAAEPTSGSFGDGTQALNAIANWLKDHAAELPAGQCQGGAGSTEGSSTVESPAATVDAPSPTGSTISPSP